MIAPVETQASDDATLSEVLRANAIERGRAIAYRAKRRGLWKSWSWANVEGEVDAIQGILRRAGVRAGMLVAIAGEANPRLYWYLLAVQRIGAVPVLINSRLGEAEFAAVHAKTLFPIFVAGSESLISLAVSVLRGCPGPRLILALDSGLDVDGHDGLVITEAKLVETADVDVRPISERDPRAVVFAAYDEAGEAILVVWSHASVAKAARVFASVSGLRDGDELVSFLPISWVGDFLQFSAALHERALISSVERSTTVFQDKRLLAPDLLLAPTSFYRKLLLRIESDIHHASRVVRWLDAWSSAIEARVSADQVREKRAGLRERVLRRFLSVVFRVPLLQVTGLSHIRCAFCSEGVLPPDLAARFRRRGLNLRPIYLDVRYGGPLAAASAADDQPGTGYVVVDGVELKQSSTGQTLCRAADPIMGVIEAHGAIVPLTGHVEGWGPAAISGRMEQTGKMPFLENIDVPGLEGRGAASLRRHATRLNSELLVRHAIFRSDGSGGWIAIIDPDVEFIRAMSVDAGALYAELIEHHDVVSAFAGIIERSNEAEVRRAEPTDALITGFAVLVRPLSAERGTLTRHGGLQHRQVLVTVPLDLSARELPNREIGPLHKVRGSQ
jgi:long-chain acyl-CoA synthetase